MAQPTQVAVCGRYLMCFFRGCFLVYVDSSLISFFFLSPRIYCPVESSFLKLNDDSTGGDKFQFAYDRRLLWHFALECVSIVVQKVWNDLFAPNA